MDETWTSGPAERRALATDPAGLPVSPPGPGASSLCETVDRGEGVATLRTR